MRYAVRTVAVSIMIIGLSSIIAMAAGATGPSISLISVSTTGEQANLFTWDASATPDGRFVVFTNQADNLVTPDARTHPDVFLRDTVAGTTTRITSNPTTGGPANGKSSSPVISSDGRYIAFVSNSTNFVAQDTGGFYGVYVFDRQTSEFTLGSVNTAGEPANGGMGSSRLVDMSPDGRYITFASTASNLSPLDQNHGADIYVRDLQTGVTRLVSINRKGVAAGRCGRPQLSSDGQLVVFLSRSRGLVAGDSNNTTDVFVRDRVAKTTERVSVSGDGAEANGESFNNPAISGGGRFVAFTSVASNLAGDDRNHLGDVFLHDRETGATKLISKTPDGSAGAGGSGGPIMSLDGKYIAFDADSVLLPDDTNGPTADVYLWDRPNQQMSLISKPLSGTQEDALSRVRAISDDGRFVYFDGGANNLVDNDTNINSDLFVLDRTG